METIEFVGRLAQELAYAFLPILAAMLVRWLMVKVEETKAVIEAEKPDLLHTLTWIAQTAVQAAEQAGAAQYISDKKAYAMSVVQDYLALKGLPIDVALISAAIEAAVLTEFNRYRPPAEG